MRDVEKKIGEGVREGEWENVLGLNKFRLYQTRTVLGMVISLIVNSIFPSELAYVNIKGNQKNWYEIEIKNKRKLKF